MSREVLIDGVGVVRPLYDRVLVKRDKEAETYASGIVKAEAYAEKPLFGEVLALGDGRLTEDGKFQEFRVKVGDRVMFGPHAGIEVMKEEAPGHLLMREDEVMAVVAAVPILEAVPV